MLAWRHGPSASHSNLVSMMTAALLFQMLIVAVLAAGFIPVVGIVVSGSRVNRGTDLSVAGTCERAHQHSLSKRDGRTVIPRRDADIPAYVASNGVIITPSIAPVGRISGSRRDSHPHAEYWTYGCEAFYE